MPENCFLVIVDVNTFYTNIDHDERAQNCFKKLEERKKSFPSIILKELILLVLNFFFRLSYSFYQQINRTVIGMPMAQNYVIIFVGKFETKLLCKYFIINSFSPRI